MKAAMHKLYKIGEAFSQLERKHTGPLLLLKEQRLVCAPVRTESKSQMLTASQILPEACNLLFKWDIYEVFLTTAILLLCV